MLLVAGFQMAYERLDGGERAPWWHTVALILLVGFCMIMSAVFSPAGWATPSDSSSTSLANPALIVMLLSFTAPFALIWRHRAPFWFTLVAAAVPLVLPIGMVPALVLVAALIGRRRGPAVWWTLGAVGVSTFVVVTLDALAQPKGASLSKMFFASEPNAANPASIPLWHAWLAGAILLAAAWGIGLLLRSRRGERDRTQEVRQQQATVSRLGDEVARRQERERIAREVHDVRGHRLSVLNLHAGALELKAGEDARLHDSASLVRESAGKAMDDLRSLLGVLREPLGEEPVAIPLARLPEVIAESFGAGQTINSSIYIADPERADPALSRAVYRIVQEVLTNARKHAPTSPVTLSVQGSPDRGVVIDARNHYEPASQVPQPGSTRGLKGIAERAELLGGSMRYGLTDGDRGFRVTVTLPWREAPRG